MQMRLTDNKTTLKLHLDWKEFDGKTQPCAQAQPFTSGVLLTTFLKLSRLNLLYVKKGIMTTYMSFDCHKYHKYKDSKYKSLGTGLIYNIISEMCY